LTSTPYEKRFGMELREMQESEPHHPDGPITMLIREELQN
jgi:hypothetical protein